MVGLCISSILIISVLFVFVAVAVNAITCTLSGIMLRTSPRRENSGRNLSPLHVKKPNGIELVFANLIMKEILTIS